jgi:large subunit ribosomal protein L6
MSRIGRKAIEIPDKVTVKVADSIVTVQGPLGMLKYNVPAGVTVSVEGKAVHVKRDDDSMQNRALHGMFRTLVHNMVTGVTQGFKRELDIIGVGYRAEVKGKELHLTLGFSHPVVFPFPEGITIKVDQQTHLTVTGPNREHVGETSAILRKMRLPEPYKGKGVRYSDEVVRRKVGKAAAGATGSK